MADTSHALHNARDRSQSDFRALIVVTAFTNAESLNTFATSDHDAFPFEPKIHTLPPIAAHN